jgi:hypothetical protein
VKFQGCCKLLLYLSYYPDMFRQLTAIFRGLHVSRKLLQFDDNICTAFVSNKTLSQNNWPDDGM